jgi:hypothetical protein
MRRRLIATSPRGDHPSTEAPKSGEENRIERLRLPIRYHDMTSIPRMASNELAIAPVIVLLMFLRIDGHAHPGMDAALKFGGLPLGHEGASCARISLEKDIVWARRLWRELSVYHARALGRRNRIARCGVQRSNKSTTEFSDAGKCVCFASEILEHEAKALISLGSIGNEAPRTDLAPTRRSTTIRQPVNCWF